MINKVILVGNVGNEPEVKQVGENKVANFSLATSEKFSGEAKSTWHNIVIWGKLAEIVEKYVYKGQLLYLEGKIQNRSYEKDGVTHYVSEVVCFQMQMLSKRENN